MIRTFDLLLRRLLQRAGFRDNQIGFDPPDEEWRKYVSGLNTHAINVYLSELRENHRRRTNEGIRQVRGGVVRESPAVRWLDCHYLISAWDPAASNIASGVEPTLSEHGVLADVAGLLLDVVTEQLTPRQAYAPDALPPRFPAEMADLPLPFMTIPEDGFPKIAEFWGTMGAGYRWKPVVYLVVTLPLIGSQLSLGPPVTTLATAYGQDSADDSVVSLQIKGSVLDASHLLANGDAAPVAGAAVQLKTPADDLLQETTSNENGVFAFAGLSAGSYKLHVASALGEKICTVAIRNAAPETELFIFY